MPTTPRPHHNRKVPGSLTITELLDALPQHVRDLDSVAIVVDFEDKGVKELAAAAWDADLHALVVSFG